MRCSARWRSATSASTFRTPTRAGRAPTAAMFLRHCARLLHERDWRLVNADLTLIAEAPRLGAAPRRDAGAHRPRSRLRRRTGSTSRPRPARASVRSVAARVWRHRRSCCSPTPTADRAVTDRVRTRAARHGTPPTSGTDPRRAGGFRRRGSARLRAGRRWRARPAAASRSAARTPAGWRRNWRGRRACRLRDVGYSGQKDRHAVTRQSYSLPWPVAGAARCVPRVRGRGLSRAVGRQARTQAAARLASREPLRDPGPRRRRATPARSTRGCASLPTRACRTISVRSASGGTAGNLDARAELGGRRRGTARPHPARLRAVGRAQRALQPRARGARPPRRLEPAAAGRGRHARRTTQLLRRAR